MIHYNTIQLLRHQDQKFSMEDWQDLEKCQKIVNKLIIFIKRIKIFLHAAQRACPQTPLNSKKICLKAKDSEKTS